MRILLLLFLTCGNAPATGAQVSTTGSDYSSSKRMIPMGSLPPVETNEDIQAKFLKQEWSPGLVSFKNSNQQMRVPLLFDVYSNKLYFLQENQIMEFLEPVSEFTLTLLRKGDSSRVTFRSFFPSIQKNTPETFYEVLVDGKIQLLKCKAKTIYLYKDQDIPEEERRYNKELLYAFLPGDKIVAIKRHKENLLMQLPDFAAAIQSILEPKKIKLKSEESLKQLFRLLNEAN